MRALVIALAALGLPGTIFAQPIGHIHQVSHCIVKVKDEADVPARAPGQLKSIAVTEGDRVQANQVAAHLDDREAQKQHEIATIRWAAAQHEAESDIGKRSAIAQAKTAHMELRRIDSANRRVFGTVPASERDRQEQEWQQALLRGEQADHEHDTSTYEVQLRHAEMQAAELVVELKSVRSPIDGQVVEVYKHVGEAVQAGE
ncbi:unnamed protein product, partial [marine sediment metagenome]